MHARRNKLFARCSVFPLWVEAVAVHGYHCFSHFSCNVVLMFTRFSACLFCCWCDAGSSFIYNAIFCQPSRNWLYYAYIYHEDIKTEGHFKPPKNMQNTMIFYTYIAKHHALREFSAHNLRTKDVIVVILTHIITCLLVKMTWILIQF